MSVTPISLTEKGKEIFGVQDMVSLCRVLRDGSSSIVLQSLHQMHRDIVYEIPSDVEQLAFSPKCTNQGMYAKGRLITVQGHPEFTGDIVTELLEARHASGVFDDTMFNDGMDRVRDKHEGVVVGKAFVHFALDG